MESVRESDRASGCESGTGVVPGQDTHLKPVRLLLGPRLGFEQFVHHLDNRVVTGSLQ